MIRRVNVAWCLLTDGGGVPPVRDVAALRLPVFTVTFLTQQNGKGKSCLHCLETDHIPSECALAPQHSSSLETKKDLMRAKCERSCAMTAAVQSLTGISVPSARETTRLSTVEHTQSLGHPYQ